MERELQDGSHVVDVHTVQFPPLIRTVKDTHAQHGGRGRGARFHEKLRRYFQRAAPTEDDGALLLWRFVHRAEREVLWDVTGGMANDRSPFIGIFHAKYEFYSFPLTHRFRLKYFFLFCKIANKKKMPENKSFNTPLLIMSIVCLLFLLSLLTCNVETVEVRHVKKVRFSSDSDPSTPASAVTRDSFSLSSSSNLPSMKSQRKTALFVSWSKCHHCTSFDPIWKSFADEHADSDSDVLKVTLDAGEPEADETVKWLLTTPVFQGSFPTILGFPEGGGDAVVYTGPREAEPLRSWFGQI